MFDDDNMTEARVTERPECDIHKRDGHTLPALYDGKTTFGPWAYMCQQCFEWYGVGLGTGRGQLLIVRNEQ